MNNVNDIFKICENLSLFELHQLRNAISNVINDPKRGEAIKQHLKVGMKINYFNSRKNDFFAATIIDIRQTKVSLAHDCDGEEWTTKFSAINLDGFDTRIDTLNTTGILNKNSLKVGDHVGWKDDKTGHDVYGVITKLNPKTAKITLADGHRWTVHYEYLFIVTDGASSASVGQLLIEGEVIR